MTSTTRTARRDALGGIISVGCIAFLLYVSLDLSGELASLVSEGLRLSLELIIPSVLPFLILCDPIRALAHPEQIKPLGRLFERIFRINSSCVSVFLLGAVCGFPIGAKMALDCYDNGIISKDECERLMAISNNASPAYVISAVGAGLRGSEREGVILYSSAIISSVISGIIISFGKRKTEIRGDIPRQRYSFIESVKSSVLTCLNVAAFVTVFSVLFGMCRLLCRDELVLTLLASVLEIASGARYISELNIFSPCISLALCSFCISFSGLCVGAQTLSLIKRGSSISPARYLLYKLLSGVISFAVSIIFYCIFI